MNLENLNLIELNAQEVQETKGGIFSEIAAGIIVYVVLCAIENPDAFIKGFNFQMP